MMAGDALAGAHDPSDLVLRRLGSLRIFLAPEAFMTRNSLIFRILAANSWKATNTLWAAIPRMRRRSGSSMASWAPF